MRATTLFFVLGLVALATASKQVSVFAELESNQFGSTLLDLVQINMQSNTQAEMTSEDSLNQISELLNDIRSDMQLNKKDADSEHKDFQAKADADIIQYQKVIKEQKERLAQTQKQLAHDRKQLGETKAELASAQKHLASVVAQIAAADKANKEALAVFAKTTKELREAIAACKEANIELAKLSTGSFAEGESINMVQIKSGMQKVELALQAHMPSRLAIYQPIITALVDMGTNADPVLVKKVQGLISELQENLEKELADTIANEKVRVADYVKLRSDLVNDQRQTEQRIGRCESVIKSLEYNIKQNEAVEAGLQKTIPAQEKLLAIREAEKKYEQEQYVKENASRVSELKVIDQLIKYFAAKIGNMSSYMRNRVAKTA